MRLGSWFTRQPVGIRVALITAMATVLVGVIGFWASVMNRHDSSRALHKCVVVGIHPEFHLQPRFEPYVVPEPSAHADRVSIMAFTLDSRHTSMEFRDTPGADYKFEIRGDAWPVFLSAFYNATNRPVAFTGIEVVHYLSSRRGGLCAGIGIEPFAAVDVHLGGGLQPFLPPLMLPAKEAGAIHIRLKPKDGPLTMEPYGDYLFRFHVGDEIIESPKFRWLPNP
jgi:hypothetical protein